MLTPLNNFLACGSGGSSIIFGVSICMGFFHGLFKVEMSHRIFGGRIVVRAPSCAHVYRSLSGLYLRYRACKRGRGLLKPPGCCRIFAGGGRSSTVGRVDLRVRKLMRRVSGAGSKMLLGLLGGCPFLSMGTRGDMSSGH